MIVVFFVVSRFDEKERPYVSTSCPTPEREKALREQGYQIHLVRIVVPTTSDGLKQAEVIYPPAEVRS